MFWSTKKTPDLPPKAVAAALWGRKAQQMHRDKDWSRNLWQSHPITQKHIQQHMSGDPAKNWLTFVKEHYCPQPRERGLSLGCGDGAAERDSIRMGICRHIDAIDLSPGAIETARQQARIAGVDKSINYEIGDLDQITLPEATYDVVIAGQSVHHITNLENLAEQLHKSMTPDGILIINEYVGPSRYQWTDKTNTFMNDLLHLLPPEKRVMQNGTTKDSIIRPTPEQVIAVDPTESVRSAEIMPIFRQHFETDYHADFGGTLLQFLLSDIIANFHEDDPMDRALIDTLVYFEQTLIKEHVIDSDFIFAIMKPIHGA